MSGIFVFAENKLQTLELLSAGRKLADGTGTKVSLLLPFEREKAQDYFAFGADEVLILPELAADQPLNAYVPVVAEELQRAGANCFLLAATFRGKEIGAQIAARLNAGLCSGCTKIEIDPETKAFTMERLAYGGAALQRIVCATTPVVTTVSAGVFEPAQRQEGRAGEVRELPMPPLSPLKVKERKAKPKEAKDITEARVIVCPGRGLAKQEDLAMIRELSELLGGEVAGTRPLTEELRWLPEEMCIGLSGVSVKPELYLGIGVSGQVQHTTGIRNAKVVAAINKDEHAPIFEVSDYGITGDLYDVVPKLIRALKK
jgi:electron transfer flavoprotein alpha subunit